MKLFPSCRQVADNLTDYEEKILSPAARLGVGVHLLVCGRCRKFRKAMLGLHWLARTLLHEPGRPLTDSTRRLIRRTVKRVRNSPLCFEGQG